MTDRLDRPWTVGVWADGTIEVWGKGCSPTRDRMGMIEALPVYSFRNMNEVQAIVPRVCKRRPNRIDWAVPGFLTHSLDSVTKASDAFHAAYRAYRETIGQPLVEWAASIKERAVLHRALIDQPEPVGNPGMSGVDADQ